MKTTTAAMLIMGIILTGSLTANAQWPGDSTLAGFQLGKGANIYVSPTGTPEGPGTTEKPYDLLTALSGDAGAEPGDTIWLLGGFYDKHEMIESTLTGTPEKPIIVRQTPGQRATISGRLVVRGADTWYWGFEVQGVRDFPKKKNDSSFYVYGPRTRFINLSIHRGLMGFYMSTPPDSEIYGCLIYDFGWGQGNRGHGHAIYTRHNQDAGTQRLVDNILFAGFGWNLHVYTQTGQASGYHIEGNTSFFAGAAANPLVAPQDNLMVTAFTPADRIKMISNISYHPRTGGWRPNLRLMPYKENVVNKTGLVKDNYIMGLRGMDIMGWEKMTITGNEVWAPGPILNVGKPADIKAADWQVGNNTYHAGADEAKFNEKTFAEYQRETGLDANSTLVPTKNGRPAGTRVFVRPNKYERGRANVSIFNWDGKDAVEVDLSNIGLKKGQKFQVHNVLGLFAKPVVQGEYTGKPVSVPMLKSPIAPDFDAFIVIPAAAAGSYKPRPDEPKDNWRTRNWNEDNLQWPVKKRK